MSPTWDWTSQIAGTAFTIVFRLLDWYVTKHRFPALGIDEDRRRRSWRNTAIKTDTKRRPNPNDP